MNKCCVFEIWPNLIKLFCVWGLSLVFLEELYIRLRFVDLGQARYTAELKHSCLGNGPFYVID